MVITRFVVATLIVVSMASATAQQLIDRIVARVGTETITLSDVQAAIGLGIVDVRAGQNAQQAAIPQLIDRQLILAEVARFPPPDPAPAAIAAEADRLKMAAGTRLAQLMDATGLDASRLNDIARDSLRIQGYLAQRFGTTVQVSDAEAREYFREHTEEFRRNGVQMSFDEAESLVRERAADERRSATIAKWLSDLRARAEVVELPL